MPVRLGPAATEDKFWNKNANFDPQMPYLSLERGIIAAVVPRGAAHSTCRSFVYILQIHGLPLAAWYYIERASPDGLVTSRKPDDIPAFNRKMIEEFCEGKHARKEA